MYVLVLNNKRYISGKATPQLAAEHICEQIKDHHHSNPDFHCKMMESILNEVFVWGEYKHLEIILK